MRFKLSALILILCFGRCRSEEPVVKPLSVVRIWKDLLAQPVIDLGGGVKIRLGIENLKSPKWSGVLLYCFAEGYAPALKGDLNNMVGPVHVELQYGQVEHAQDISVSQRQSSDMDEVLKRSKVLYCKLIPINRIGKLRITLRKSKDGDPLARFELEGTDDSFHPWMPLVFGNGHAEQLEPPTNQEKDVSVGAVSMRSDGIALPDWDGQQGMIFDDKKRDMEAMLPKAVPATESPQMTIAVKGNAIRIASTSDFLVRRPDWHFLSRWWVNEKPYIPKQLTEFPGDADGLVSTGRTLDLHVTFDAEKIGAKKGDKIGLQLLYCRDEWSWVGDVMMAKAHMFERDMDGVHLTNRVEFEAP